MNGNGQTCGHKKTGPLQEAVRFILVSIHRKFRLDAARNLAGTEATGANVHFGRLAVNDDMDGLNVRRPAALGLAVGVAHQITGHDTLVADFTVFTHA
jgi:hypothetical protein